MEIEQNIEDLEEEEEDEGSDVNDEDYPGRDIPATPVTEAVAEDDTEEEYTVSTKKQKVDSLNTWTDNDKAIWESRFLNSTTPPNFEEVEQMLKIHTDMMRKVNHKYANYCAGKQRINMLANTVRKFIARRHAKLHAASLHP